MFTFTVVWDPVVATEVRSSDGAIVPEVNLLLLSERGVPSYSFEAVAPVMVISRGVISSVPVDSIIWILF